MLFIRPIRCRAGVAHLSGADEPNVVVGLLAPQHQGTERLAISQRHVADLKGIRDHLAFVKQENRGDRPGVDHVAAGNGQHGLEAHLASLLAFGQQEVPSRRSDEIFQVLGAG